MGHATNLFMGGAHLCEVLYITPDVSLPHLSRSQVVLRVRLVIPFTLGLTLNDFLGPSPPP